MKATPEQLKLVAEVMNWKIHWDEDTPFICNCNGGDNCNCIELNPIENAEQDREIENWLLDQRYGYLLLVKMVDGTYRLQSIERNKVICKGSTPSEARLNAVIKLLEGK